MKKFNLLAFYFISLVSNFSFAQDWQAVNPPLNLFNNIIYSTSIDASGNVYAAGDFENSSHYKFVAKWDGTKWAELGSGTTTLKANGTILTTTVNAAGNIFAAGAFLNIS